MHNGNRHKQTVPEVKISGQFENGQVQEPLTLSIPDAGAMAGLAKNASYAAARRGEIPVMKFGSKRRVPAVRWKRILAEGRDPSDAE